MPTVVYRVTQLLSSLVEPLPIGTNLGLFHLLWMLVSGRLLESRGAVIPGLAALGLDRIVILYTFVVREGRIVLYSLFPDVTDPQTARFVAAQQAQPQPLPRALPNTGDGSCEDDPSTCE